MWQTDTVTFQTEVEVNAYGSIASTWTDTVNTVKCDVQDLNKELAHKTYGLSSNTEFKQVYDLTQSSYWTLGSQVKYNSTQWLVKLIQANMGKMNKSNHKLIILEKVT
jgi:hypothetical protein